MNPSLRPFHAAALMLAAVLCLGAADQPARKRVAIVIDDGPDQTQSAQYHALFDCIAGLSNRTGLPSIPPFLSPLTS